jgi:E3 ubiquitin-protein ligase UBR1
VDVRENTLDCDIYLLQVGLVVCDSNQILLTLMDRFQLVDWFRGKPGKCKNYDASQTVYMVEDFLNLLIICATEHGYASDVSTEQRIRQSIIQYLGIGSMSYSELLKLIPESISDHESFETQLNMIANYKAPDGLSDKGLYEIKSEYLDEIEPYHWHYTRNQREEAQHVLKKRWNQLNPDNKVDDKEEYLVIPKIKRIEIGPFRHLGKFLHSHLICQIIAYALWDAKFHKASKSDTILDEALYLAMLAVTDPNSSASELAAMKVEGRFRADVLIDESNTKHFVDFAEADEYSIQINEIEKTHASLLVILLRCLDDPELAHAHKRLGFIVDKIEYYGSDVAKERIAEYKERKARETKAELERTGGSGESEYERKRAAAKARQAAIMSQFANAQSKFMEQHADLYKTEEDEDIREAYEDTATGANDISSEDDVEIIRKCHFPADNCIVCQEELDDSKLFGMLGLIQQANTQRLAPLDNKDVLAEVLETSNSANPWVPKDESNTDKLPPFSGFPTDAHLSGLDISSCGHLMHSECFDNYQQSVDTHLLGELGRMFPLAIPPKSRFLCPLCKALGNVLVPIVWKGKKESYPGVMAPSTPYADLTRVVKDAADILKKSFEQIPGSFDEEQPFVNTDPDLVISDQEKLKHIYNQLMKVIHATWDKKSIERASNLADSIRALYDMYSYTITDFEIAQRGTEGTRARDLTVEHTGTFIDDIPNTSQTLLKVLGLTNTLIQKLMNSPWQAEDRFTQERLALQAINQFIPNTVSHLVEDMVEADTLKPLLVDDPFKALVRLSFSVAECPSIEAHHLLRSIYLAELSKTVVALASSFLNDDKLLKDNKISQLLQSLNLDQQQSSEAEAVQQFATYVLGLTMPQASIDRFFHCVHPGALTALIRTFALPFLRKSLLFMVVHHGFILQDPSNDMQEKNEFDNLLDILRLPSLNNLFELQTFEQEMIGGWCKDYLKYSPTEYQTSPNNDPVSISLNLPTRFRMTTLPYRLDQLLDESLKRVCKNCKTVPEHSAICLICGTFVCARRFCCTKGNKGECNTHMKQ